MPVNALLFRSEGLRWVVDSDHSAHLQAMTVGRDYGVALEVLDGLTAAPLPCVLLRPYAVLT